eukprot:Lankesteria_metandrocarpae@DN9584_c0_g1_i1.p1
MVGGARGVGSSAMSLLIKDPEVANKTWTVSVDTHMTVAEVVRMFLMRRNRHLTQACQLRLMFGTVVLSEHLDKTLTEFKELSEAGRCLLHSMWKPSAGGCFNAATCNRCLEIENAGKADLKTPVHNKIGGPAVPAHAHEYDSDSPHGHPGTSSPPYTGNNYHDLPVGNKLTFGSQPIQQLPPYGVDRSVFGSAPVPLNSSPTGGKNPHATTGSSGVMYSNFNYAPPSEIGDAPWMGINPNIAPDMTQYYNGSGRGRSPHGVTDGTPHHTRAKDMIPPAQSTSRRRGNTQQATFNLHEQDVYQEVSNKAGYRRGQKGISSAAVDLLSCLDRLVSTVGETTDVVNHLERLDGLRRSGALSEVEFLRAKHHVLYGGSELPA